MKLGIGSICVALSLVGLLSITSSAKRQTAPKKPGVVRFGIVGAGGQSIPDAQAQATNAQLVQMLGGESEDDGYEAVLLQGKLDVLIREEARKKECDYILFVKEFNSTIGAKKPSGGNPFSVVRDALELAPDSVSKSKGAAEAQTKMDKAPNLLKSISGATKKKDKVGVKFSLVAVGGGAEIIADTLKEKVATKDGEDLLGGVLVEVGNLVLNAITRR